MPLLKKPYRLTIKNDGIRPVLRRNGQMGAAPNISDSANPKDKIGRAKVSTYVASSIGRLQTAFAMMDGATKYGPYNYRDTPVSATIYLDACNRHIEQWQDREEYAEDSKAHHLGHACACLFIIMDAQANGTLIDDRPKTRGQVVRLIKKLNSLTLAKQQSLQSIAPNRLVKRAILKK